MEIRIKFTGLEAEAMAIVILDIPDDLNDGLDPGFKRLCEAVDPGWLEKKLNRPSLDYDQFDAGISSLDPKRADYGVFTMTMETPGQIHWLDYLIDRAEDCATWDTLDAKQRKACLKAAQRLRQSRVQIPNIQPV